MGRFHFVDTDDAGAVFARLALEGPAGGGKTWTALTLARGLGDNTGVIDAEHRSALKYRKLFRFKHLPMSTYSPKDLTEAIADAAEERINPLIIDSWSPFWDGTEGVLEQVDTITAAANRNDKFSAGWHAIRPVERAMLDAMLSYPGHLIVTMRVKTDYVMQTDPRTGRIGPVKVGLKPIQRDNSDSLFDVVASMDGACLTVTKSRCPNLFGTIIEKPTEEVAYVIRDWLDADSLPEHLDPYTVREWALDPARTVDELSHRLDEVNAAGLAGAAVRSPSGTVWPLGEFLTTCQRKIRESRENATAAAARNAAAAKRTNQTPAGMVA